MPEPRGNASPEAIDALCKRAVKAWAVADIQHNALKEAYRWLMPAMYAEMTAGGPGQQGNVSGISDHIFDDEAVSALEDGASQIAEAMHPWDQVWARWVPKNSIPEDDRGQLEELAEKITDVCTDLLATSNFDGAAATSHKEFLFGTGFLLIDKDIARPGRIRCTATPAYRWAIEADVAGRIQAAFFRMPIRARDTETEIPGGTWSAETQKLAKEQPEAMVDVEMAIYWLPVEKLWRTCIYEKKSKVEVWSTRGRTSPLICYRSGLTAGRAWGYGPAMRIVPTVRVANKVVELTLKYASIAVTGIWTAEDDGVLNPNTVRLIPGTIIPIAPGSGGLQPLKSPGNFDLSSIILADLHAKIRRSFWVTRVEEREMSATEYQGRLQQQMREQRGTYGQLKGEFAEAVQLRVLDLAVEMGLIDIPNFDQLAEVQLTGPLAQDVRGAAVDRVKQVVGDIAMMAGPEIAMASLKLEKVVPWIAGQRHANLDMFRNEGELKDLAAQIAQQAAALQAQQLAGTNGAAAPPPPPAGMPM